MHGRLENEKLDFSNGSLMLGRAHSLTLSFSSDLSPKSLSLISTNEEEHKFQMDPGMRASISRIQRIPVTSFDFM